MLNQIVGKMSSESTVPQISKAFEEILPWENKKPQFNFFLSLISFF